MRRLLGMIVKNEELMLKRHLPRMWRAFDGIVAADTGSTDDTVKVLEKFGADVFPFSWCNDFSAARNAVIERGGFDVMLMLDGDECMFESDIAAVLEYAQDAPVRLPRYAFANMYRIVPKHFPDWQTRAFPPGLRYAGKVHEHLVCEEVLTSPATPIYHYGWLKDARFVWLKGENYRRMVAGEPLLTEVPDGVDLAEMWYGTITAPGPTRQP